MHADGTIHVDGEMPSYVLNNWFPSSIQRFSGVSDMRFDYVPEDHITIKTQHDIALAVLMPDLTTALHMDHLSGVNTWQWTHRNGTHISGKVDHYTLDNAVFKDVRYEYMHDNALQSIYLSDFQTQHLRFVLPWLANHEELSSNAIKQYGLGGKVQNLRLCWQNGQLQNGYFELDHFSITPSYALPGISGINAKVHLQDNTVKLSYLIICLARNAALLLKISVFL